MSLWGKPLIAAKPPPPQSAEARGEPSVSRGGRPHTGAQSVELDRRARCHSHQIGRRAPLRSRVADEFLAIAASKLQRNASIAASASARSSASNLAVRAEARLTRCG